MPGRLNHAVFRTDASPRIGGGHVMRCLTLADALMERGWHCSFACGEETIDTIPLLGRSSHRLVKPNSTEDCTLLVVDHYGLDAAFEKSCRPFVKHILVIDDLTNRPHDCDLLLDQTFGRDAAEYAKLVPDDCTVLTGSKYALLRPMFSTTRPPALAARAAKGNISRVLVSLGSTDPDNVTSTVLESLSRLSNPVKVDVVLGRNAPYLAHVQALTETLSLDITLFVDCDNMAERYRIADLAIGAAGSSSWERCCLGLPTLMIVIADNQQKIAVELAEAGAAINLDKAKNLGWRQITTAIEGLMSTPEVMRVMSAKAAALCDGCGTQRVLDRIFI